MKRIYQEPSIEAVKMNLKMIICGSRAIHSDEADIGYGGVDEEGELDPAARRHYNVWEDEESEESEETMDL